MSTINTSGLDVNYPVAGINNSSQGFRDNFASIKNNLNTAGTEITDLQNKVILKAGLTDTAINNNMANTLISNALTRSFRATTYNLGNALSGTVLVDVSLGDVQYGTVSENVTFQFGGWAPTGTQSNVQLQLAVSNSSAVVTFPSEIVYANNNFGVTTLENYSNVANTPTVTIPYGVTQLDYRLSSVDCGDSIVIEPFNRPRAATQIQQRTPSPIGFPGDVAGTFSVDGSYAYFCTDTYNATTTVKAVTGTTATTNEVTLNNITSLVTNAPIVFSGTTIGGLVAGTLYYIKTIVGANTAVTVSNVRSANTAGNVFVLTTETGNCTATSYNGTAIWKRIALTTW